MARVFELFIEEVFLFGEEDAVEKKD